MTVALICARGGSKRIPRKNTAMCAGRHLIEWPIRAALAAKSISALYVSTDDAEIKRIAEDNGAIVIDRPWQLATDKAGDGAMMYHAFSRIIRDTGADLIVKLHATSPCVEEWHIDEAVQMMEANPLAVQVCTIHKVTKPSQMNNYYFMVPGGAIMKIFPETPIGVNPYITNNLVDLYYQNGAFHVERVEPKFYNLAPEIAEDADPDRVNYIYATFQGRIELERIQEARNLKLGYVMDEWDGHDINYPLDLVVADALLRHKYDQREGL